ncbi:MAG: alanine racemase [Candidatus Eremiobacteraeota bacterium]|nr:alanine racemase [Candidatus Eremiobacteraeota bacterium]
MIAQLTIDRDALRANVAALWSLVYPAGYAAVVKANAYGHGLIETARALDGRVATFCTYRAAEAAALRAAGINTPLLVLGPVEPSELTMALASGAALTVWNAAFARTLSRFARMQGTRWPIHVKVDSGVTRLGFEPHDAAAAIATFLDDDGLDLRGVFTHLAAAEELESAYTLGQLVRFEEALAPLGSTLAAHGVVRHAAASAAAMLYPRLRLDLIRAGIATYGIWPSPQTRAVATATLDLTPALTWSTKIVLIRDVEAGRSVGYGCSFTTARPSRIGVLPIGYAEGLPRALSGDGAGNGGAALLHGRRVPFVGRICMNMSFVDVTDVSRAGSGSTVTLIGRDGDDALDANELAAAAGTIGYELVARLPPDMPRRYVGAETPAQTP